MKQQLNLLSILMWLNAFIITAVIVLELHNTDKIDLVIFTTLVLQYIALLVVNNIKTHLREELKMNQ